MVAVLIYQGSKGNIGVVIVGPIILTIGFLAMKLFIYGNSFKTYNAGGQAIKELKGKKIEVLENIGIYIKGFDLFDQKNFFPPNIQKTIYDFDKADLVLTEYSMVLMGKSGNFGGEAFAYPVEILIDKSWLTSLPKAQIKNWEEVNNRINIQIEDYNYKKSINIDFKDRTEEIKRWLHYKSNSG
ncbi:hypothetical protein [Aquiflexum balticum]|nr:hypothetical protein [Aquiflexum balticum]